MIGARFSLYPMTDAYVPRILEALKTLDGTALERETDDVSTFLSGEENLLFKTLTTTFQELIASGEHAAVSLLLSRGCPGEPGKDLCDPVATPSQAEALLDTQGTGPDVACQFSLYPLGVGGYMDAIYAEITEAGRAAGLEVTPQHLCTRLYGPLTAVMGQLRRAFDRTAEVTPHVVIHATLSANSPSPQPQPRG